MGVGSSILRTLTHRQSSMPSLKVPPKSTWCLPVPFSSRLLPMSLRKTLVLGTPDPGPALGTLTLLQAGDQLVDDVLHDTVQLEVEQRLCLVDLGVTHGAVLAGLQVLNNATLADCSQREGVSGGATTPHPQTPSADTPPLPPQA